MSLLNSIQSGAPFVVHLDAGLHEVIYSFRALDFDIESLYFTIQGTRTGPWDYAPQGPAAGKCLLPFVELNVSSGRTFRARVIIPPQEELDRHEFSGRAGFWVEKAQEVTVRVTASLKAEWISAKIEPVRDFLDLNLQACDFKTTGRFFLDDSRLDLLQRNWGRAPWCRTLDAILDDCGKYAPPCSREEAELVNSSHVSSPETEAKPKDNCRTSSLVMLAEKYEDKNTFWGDYLACLSLRTLVLGREEDRRQLTQWVDEIVALPVWGYGNAFMDKDYNNDLVADFNMWGLFVAFNWHRSWFGGERNSRIKAKISYQAEQMRNWIIHSRSSWPSTTTQNHAYYGIQTLLLAGCTLLEDGYSTALDDLRIAAAHFRRFAENLSLDGSYHEGIGYVSFGLQGLLPGLFVLEQMMNKPWLPHSWLDAHYPAMNDLMPEIPGKGFAIDDGDLSFPSNVFFTLWAWKNVRSEAARTAAGQILRKLHQVEDSLALADKVMVGNFWRLVLVPEVCDPEGEFPPLQQRHAAYMHLTSADIGIIPLQNDRHAYFFAGPPHGHDQFRKEQHYYAYGHHHPDVGNVVLIDRGHWVLADTGYTFHKSSAEHNVLLVDGQGQHNDNYVWMSTPPWDIEPTRMIVTQQQEYVRADANPAYMNPRRLGLVEWKRSVRGGASGLVVVDEFETRHSALFTISWGSDFEWSEESLRAWKNSSGWRLEVFALAITHTIEAVHPIRRYRECDHPWHVVRLRNAEPATGFRLVSVVMPPETAEEAGALAQRYGACLPKGWEK